MKYLSEDKWADALDRLEELCEYSLPSLRRIAEVESNASRGRCLAEILTTEFEYFLNEIDTGEE